VKVEMISVVYGTIIAAFIALGMCSLSAASAQTGPSINATNVFDSGQMILPGNAKHLVILIPNEGHHGPGEEDESRFIAQSFVPQNVVINPGTQVIWFNGDVGHEHNIVVTDESNSPVFETGEFTELQASRPFMFNNTGDFDYADTVEYEEGFVMTGNIIVNGQGSGGQVISSSSFDTVGALMVPSMMVQDVTDEMRNVGFAINSMHNFKDLRAGQSDTGDEQVLVIWTSAGKSLNDVTSQLGEISEGLPYE
jgi:plastocyanin